MFVLVLVDRRGCESRLCAQVQSQWVQREASGWWGVGQNGRRGYRGHRWESQHSSSHFPCDQRRADTIWMQRAGRRWWYHKGKGVAVRGVGKELRERLCTCRMTVSWNTMWYYVTGCSIHFNVLCVWPDIPLVRMDTLLVQCIATGSLVRRSWWHRFSSWTQHPWCQDWTMSRLDPPVLCLNTEHILFSGATIILSTDIDLKILTCRIPNPKYGWRSVCL